MSITTNQNQTKLKEWQELTKIHGIDELKEELKLFKLDRAPLSTKEIFKSMPKQILVPSELLEWMKQFINECYEIDLDYKDIITIIRTKAIDHGYSSKQVLETLKRAIDQVSDRYRNRYVNREYERFSKN